jgi:hypothetical protein
LPSGGAASLPGRGARKGDEPQGKIGHSEECLKLTWLIAGVSIVKAADAARAKKSGAMSCLNIVFGGIGLVRGGLGSVSVYRRVLSE